MGLSPSRERVKNVGRDYLGTGAACQCFTGVASSIPRVRALVIFFMFFPRSESSFISCSTHSRIHCIYFSFGPYKWIRETVPKNCLFLKVTNEFDEWGKQLGLEHFLPPSRYCSSDRRFRASKHLLRFSHHFVGKIVQRMKGLHRIKCKIFLITRLKNECMFCRNLDS